MDRCERVIFRGKQYIVLDHIDSCIATEEQYINGLTPFAHLYEHRGVWRFHKRIGSTEDVVFTGIFVDLEPTDAAFESVVGLSTFADKNQA